MTVQDAQNFQGKPVILTMNDGSRVPGTIVQLTEDSATFKQLSGSTVLIQFADVQSVAPLTFTTSGVSPDQIAGFVGHQVAIVYTSVNGRIRAVGTLQSVDATNIYLSVNGTVNPIALAAIWSAEDLGVQAKASVASQVASFANTVWGKALILGAVGVGGWWVGKNWDEFMGGMAGTEPEGEEETDGEEDGGGSAEASPEKED